MFVEDTKGFGGSQFDEQIVEKHRNPGFAYSKGKEKIRRAHTM